MRLSLCCLFVLPVCVTATEKQWVYLGVNDSGTKFYIDASTVKENGNSRYARTLWNRSTPDEDKSMSDLFLHEYDCNGWRWRPIELTSYSGQMATGNIITQIKHSTKWFPMERDTASYYLIKHVCQKK
jgi:hypothetical protein